MQARDPKEMSIDEIFSEMERLTRENEALLQKCRDNNDEFLRLDRVAAETERSIREVMR